MKRLVFAILSAAAIALALPHPSHAQAVKGMTLDQYMLMQERVDAFCSFYADQVAGNKPWPSASAGVTANRPKDNATAAETLIIVFMQSPQ